MLTCEIEQDVLTMFPAVTVMALRVEGIQGMTSAQIDFAAALADNEALAFLAGDTTGLAGVTAIAEWRDAFKRQGLKPSEWRSSVEALVRRVMKDDDLVSGLAAVDLYNEASVRHLAPLGAYDAARLPAGEMKMRLMRPADTFTPLGTVKMPKGGTDNVVVYAIENEVLCFAINHRDSAMAALREDTDCAVFFAEAVSSTQRIHAEQALRYLADRFAAYGALVGEIKIANAETPRLEIA